MERLPGESIPAVAQKSRRLLKCLVSNLLYPQASMSISLLQRNSIPVNLNRSCYLALGPFLPEAIPQEHHLFS